MARKKRRTGVGGPSAVPEDPDFNRDEAAQPDLTEAQRKRKASGEARAARSRDNTFHARKAKLAHLTDQLPQALWDAFLDKAVRPRVKNISERGVIGSLLLGFLLTDDATQCAPRDTANPCIKSRRACAVLSRVCRRLWQWAARSGAGAGAGCEGISSREAPGHEGLVEAARPDLSPAQVDVVVAEVNKRMTMGSKQCVLAAVPCLVVLLQSFLGQPTPGFPTAGPAPGPPPPPDPACPPYAHPRLATRSSPRNAAAPAQLPPPVQLNIWDPLLLAQIKDAMELLAKAIVLEHMMRGPHHRGIRLLPGEVAVLWQPSNAWLIAMLKDLDEVHLLGDGNSLNTNAIKIITSIQEFYWHPGRFISWWCKAVGVVEGGFSRTMKKYFPQLVLGRLDYSLPGREHKWRLPPNSVLWQPRWVAEVAKHRRLLGLPAQWREGVDSIGKGGAVRLPLEKRAHILALKATWDALWDEYLKPRWHRQRLGLHHA
ncbi:hypothetical protein QJQ45_017699 [Haematococcus lacustris]|nr:hypothetical protein QJQ45_017699 [Haematococcus lacustris]